MAPGERQRIRVRTDGVLSAHIAALHREVFGDDVDAVEWRRRMRPRYSWAVSSVSGFIAAHERSGADGRRTINLWLAGVAPDARRRGELRALLARLLRCIGWCARLTMSTRPRRFAVMFDIMSRHAAPMVEEDGDRGEGKLRFAVAAWRVWLVLHRWRLISVVAFSSAALAWSFSLLLLAYLR